MPFESLREEEEEPSSESEPEDVWSSTTEITDDLEQKQCVDELLAELQKGRWLQDSDEGHENTTDTTLNALKTSLLCDEHVPD